MVLNGNMRKQLTLCSLFDGSGGFCLGALLSGIKPIALSEIEPFPLRVTEKRLPFVKQYGDVNKLKGTELPPVDVITFGSPCQDMSIAGKRSGVHGERSGLFFQAIRIIKEMRCATHGKYPKYAVWENVTGALSSNKGEDFRQVLERFCQIKEENINLPRPEKWTPSGCIMGDGYSIAYRTLDAAGWGVPQRRKRIFLVADLDGERAGKILFESEGLSGYSAESFRSWQETAGGAGESTAETGRIVLNDQGGLCMNISEDKTGTLRAQANHPPLVMSAGFCTEHSAQSRGIGFESEKSPTLRAQTVPATLLYENHSQDTRYTGPLETAPTISATYGMGGNNQPFVVQTMRERHGCAGGGKGPLCQIEKSATLATNNDQTVFVPFGICSKNSNSMKSDNPNSGFYEADTARTLDTSGSNPSCNQGGVVVVEGNGSRPSHHGDGYKDSETMYTLNTVEQHSVAYGIDRAAFNQGKNALYNFAVEEEQQPTMVAKGPGAVAQPASFYPHMKAESQCYRDDGLSNTIVNGTNPGFQNAVLYTTSKASYHTLAEKNVAHTLVASDYKDPPLINDGEYIVRRLTPQECALLQGFPPNWCIGLESPDPSEEEITKWSAVWNEWNSINGKKPRSRNQVIKWLKAPYSDSAEYKLWGNGLFVGLAYFVLAGIKWAEENF